MKFIIGNEYTVITPRKNSSIPDQKQIIVIGEDEARYVNDYYGPAVHDLETLAKNSTVILPYNSDQVRKVVGDIESLIAAGQKIDAMEYAAEFKKDWIKHGHVVFGTGAITISDYQDVEYVLYGAMKGIKRSDYVCPFKFRIGRNVMLQDGNEYRIVGRSMSYVGYETIAVVDRFYHHRRIHIYDRSNSRSDSGRATGSCHQYTDKHNVYDKEVGNRHIKFKFACIKLQIDPEVHDLFRTVHPVPALDAKVIELLGGHHYDLVKARWDRERPTL